MLKHQCESLGSSHQAQVQQLRSDWEENLGSRLNTEVTKLMAPAQQEIAALRSEVGKV